MCKITVRCKGIAPKGYDFVSWAFIKNGVKQFQCKYIF